MSGNPLAISAINLSYGPLKFITGESRRDAEWKALKAGHFFLAMLSRPATDKEAQSRQKHIDFCIENAVLTKAHTEGLNSAGGVFVPDEIAQIIIELRDNFGVVRRLATVLPMGSDTMIGSKRRTGLTAYPVGEANQLTESQAAWDPVSLTAKKWGVLTFISSELDEDAVINIGDTIAGEMAYALAVAEDTAAFSGDGSATYHGMKGLRTLFAEGIAGGANPLFGAVDAASGHDTFAELDAADLNKLLSVVPQYVFDVGDPRWFCSSVAWALTFERLITNAGGILADDGGQVRRFYGGYPVEVVPSMPTAQSDISDTVMIMFGDLRMGVLLGSRRDIRIQRSRSVNFDTDQIAIKATERFDAVAHGLGDANTAGPIVALMGE